MENTELMEKNPKLQDINSSLNAEEIESSDMEGNDEKAKNVPSHRYLTFELDGEQYGVKIGYVIEIIGIQDITQLPGTPKFVKGLINLRVKIIPLIDAR